MSVPAADRRSVFRLAVVPGVTVTKWGRTWSQRLPEVALRLVPVEVADQTATLAAGHADAGLVRLPVDRDRFHAISLYTEATVVVVPRDHVVTAADEVIIADLADERLLRPLDEVPAWSEAGFCQPQGDQTVTAGGPTAVAMGGRAAVAVDGWAVADCAASTAAVAERPSSTAAAVELVAAGVGVLVVPQSLARLHHRRDLTYRTITDAPTSSVALAWPRDGHNDLIEEMIGIVRGRTANSTRGRSPDAAQPAPAAGTRKKAGAREAGTPAKGGLARRENGSGRTGGQRSGALSRNPRRRRGR